MIMFKFNLLTKLDSLNSSNSDTLKADITIDTWQSKQVGDIGTPEALQVIRDIRKDKAYEGEGGLKYCVDLYAP